MNFCTLTFCLFILGVQIIFGQIYTNSTFDGNQTDVYDENQKYCFRFTWLGPDYDNSSKFNSTTCFDFVSERGIPCQQPLVISSNGTPPDINYLWEHHRGKVLCRQARGKVCAKYSYSFNGQLQNVTYMCTKVFAKGEGAVTKGCYKQIINEYEVELCVCESGSGPYKPCNSTIKVTFNVFLFLMCLIIANLVL